MPTCRSTATRARAASAGIPSALAAALRAAGQASVSVPLAAPETEYTPRLRQLDISVSKGVQFGRVSATPKADFFNALDSDDFSSVSSTQFGAAAYQRPSVILQGRIVRVGVDMTW